MLLYNHKTHSIVLKYHNIYYDLRTATKIQNPILQNLSPYLQSKHEHTSSPFKDIDPLVILNKFPEHVTIHRTSDKSTIFLQDVSITIIFSAKNIVATGFMPVYALNSFLKLIKNV